MFINVLDTACRIHLHLMNCATMRMMNYLAQLFNCRTTYSAHYYHHHPLHHNAVTIDNVSTPYSCPNIQHNYLGVLPLRRIPNCRIQLRQIQNRIGTLLIFMSPCNVITYVTIYGCIRFICSQRGDDVLVVDEYIFHKNKHVNNKHYWNYADLLFTHLLTSDIPTLLHVLFTVTHDKMSLTTK